MATPAGVGSPEQQALMALQTELAQSRGQVLALTQRFDALAHGFWLLAHLRHLLPLQFLMIFSLQFVQRLKQIMDI